MYERKHWKGGGDGALIDPSRAQVLAAPPRALPQWLPAEGVGLQLSCRGETGSQERLVQRLRHRC